MAVTFHSSVTRFDYWLTTVCPDTYEGRTESHEQLFFTSELGTADEGECGGR